MTKIKGCGYKTPGILPCLSTHPCDSPSTFTSGGSYGSKGISGNRKIERLNIPKRQRKKKIIINENNICVSSDFEYNLKIPNCANTNEIPINLTNNIHKTDSQSIMKTKLEKCSLCVNKINQGLQISIKANNINPMDRKKSSINSSIRTNRNLLKENSKFKNNISKLKYWMILNILLLFVLLSGFLFFNTASQHTKAERCKFQMGLLLDENDNLTSSLIHNITRKFELENACSIDIITPDYSSKNAKDLEQMYLSWWSKGIKTYFIGEDYGNLKRICSLRHSDVDERVLITSVQINSITNCPGILKPWFSSDILLESAIHQIQTHENTKYFVVTGVNSEENYFLEMYRNSIRLKLGTNYSDVTNVINKHVERIPIILYMEEGLINLLYEFQLNNILNQVWILTSNKVRNLIKNDKSLYEKSKFNLMFLHLENDDDLLDEYKPFVDYLLEDPFTTKSVVNIMNKALQQLIDVNIISETSMKSIKTENIKCDKIKVQTFRLLEKSRIGYIFIQESEWIAYQRMNFYDVLGKCQIYSVEEFPIKILPKEEIQNITNFLECSSSKIITVTAQDTVTHRLISVEYSDNLPIIVVPNSGNLGYSLTAKCDNSEAIVELGCQKTESYSDEIDCIISQSINGRSRRSWRYVKSFYRFYRSMIPLERIDRLFEDDPIKQELKNLIPQIGGCIGATGGCSFCYVYLLYVDVKINPGVCYGACAVAVAGSCSTLLFRGIQYKLDHTVICSELFNQGKISIISYLADAQYGNQIRELNPIALYGYQTAATPIIWFMRSNSLVSNFVDIIAQPWIRHMEYTQGVRNEDDLIGNLYVKIGLPIFWIIGVLRQQFVIILIICISVKFIRKNINKFGFR